eukprot:TRINITY_DN17075_c0_g3_i1.p1 TRINITY_DN17075_c0_g3~~TRINITY_DN17075_c0_g3_i1.p1  ORF type:complete len:432 (+),score=80.83 TRINITY_DN17075_c0_g3_i1:39-1298(+)
MGCNSSKASAEPQKPCSLTLHRHLLSVNRAENKADNVSAQSNIISDLGDLLLILREQEHDSSGHYSIVGSQPDDDMTSFGVKAFATLAGEDFAATTPGIGITCCKGLKPESVNQDSWLMMRFNEFAVYAVFDGHGKGGHHVSNFVKQHLPMLILSDTRCKTQEWEMLLKDTFFKVQAMIKAAYAKKQLSAQLSGTTCTVVIHCHTRKQLIIAHVADSTAVLGTRTGVDCEGYALTRDHKPDLADEQARILNAGGRVVHDGYANYRVMAGNANYPGLNMSRCLGDLVAHERCGITCEPEISVVGIQASTEYLLLVCSDGLWEFLEPEEVVQLAHKHGAFTPARTQDAAEKLAKKAWDCWIKEEQGTVVDDITVMMVLLGGETNETPANDTPAPVQTKSAARPVLLGNKVNLVPKSQTFQV